ncbi:MULTISPECIES: hypothetical protein [Chryseobacterium]|jgi:hypothetical protein|uniref:Uncharacterized protein n=1 Tax=Chryseobacterium candidae TaxID=1978493 RepID=A0ABY2R9K4_9FLAO|nr:MULTISPECIES: hypothetical protein [Chryseobacterium]PXW16342.1 hypothetical protein C8D70_104281 [Chryseobacterium sp. CBTAP 102]THV59823.1 hypothetical protein EK417_10250 [Chryseobacterium candidae]SIQ50196.1 hypothetical protein SAMN05880573_10637 [Chryseobacterium sp. RU33C]
MKSLYLYLLLIVGTVIFLCSFTMERGRHIYRNHWTIPAQQNLKIKNSSKEDLEVVLYNPSQTSDLKYMNSSNELKVLPKNDSVKTRINFANEFYVVNTASSESVFRLKILNNSGRIKAFIKKQLPKN